MFISNKKEKTIPDTDDPSKVSGTGGSSSMERIVNKIPAAEITTYETNPQRKNSKST